MSERKQRPSHTEQKDRQPLPDLPRSERKPHPFFRRHTDPPKPRSSPSSRPPPPVDPATAGPWQHMANTYAWVVEQEFVQVDRRNRTTEQWIFEQKIRFPDPQERRDIEERVRRRMWEEAMNDYEVEAEKWMRHEEELRHMAVEREKQKVEALEELRRYEARMREKRNAGKRRGVWEDRYGAQQAGEAMGFSQCFFGTACVYRHPLAFTDSTNKAWGYHTEGENTSCTVTISSRPGGPPNNEESQGRKQGSCCRRHWDCSEMFE